MKGVSGLKWHWMKLSGKPFRIQMLLLWFSCFGSACRIQAALKPILQDCGLSGVFQSRIGSPFGRRTQQLVPKPLVAGYAFGLASQSAAFRETWLCNKPNYHQRQSGGEHQY
jgi:hypothetical protein